MKKLLFLSLLPSLTFGAAFQPPISAPPSTGGTNGGVTTNAVIAITANSLTNGETRAVSLNNNLTVSNSIYGPLYFNQNSPGPGIDSYQNKLRFEMTNGVLNTDSMVEFLYAVSGVFYIPIKVDTQGALRTTAGEMRIDPNNKTVGLNGSSLSSYSTEAGGGASMMSGQTITGPEVWDAMPTPPFTFYVNQSPNTGTSLTNLITHLVTNNIPAFLKAAGIPCTILLDADWAATNRITDAFSNLILTNTVGFNPLGMPWYINYAHTNDIRIRLTLYWLPDLLRPGGFQNQVSFDGNHNWQAPYQSGSGLGPWCPATSPEFVNLDFNQLSGWNVDEMRISEGNVAAVGYAGFTRGVVREVNEQQISPGNSLPYYRNTTNNHQMSVEFLIGDTNLIWPHQALLCNMSGFDQPPVGTNNLDTAIINIRNPYNGYWGKLFGRGHVPTLSINFSGSSFSANDIQGTLSILAIMPEQILFQNQYMVASHISFMTNSEFLAIWGDKKGEFPGSCIQTNGKASIWKRTLGDGSIAVCFYNQSNDVLTASINFTSLGLKANDICVVRDIWAKSNVGTAVGSYTFSNVPATNALLYKFTPQYNSISSMANPLTNETIWPSSTTTNALILQMLSGQISDALDVLDSSGLTRNALFPNGGGLFGGHTVIGGLGSTPNTVMLTVSNKVGNTANLAEYYSDPATLSAYVRSNGDVFANSLLLAPGDAGLRRLNSSTIRVNNGLADFLNDFQVGTLYASTDVESINGYYINTNASKQLVIDALSQFWAKNVAITNHLNAGTNIVGESYNTNYHTIALPQNADAWSLVGDTGTGSNYVNVPIFSKSQTNSGNIQSATLNTTGDTKVADLYVPDNGFIGFGVNVNAMRPSSQELQFWGKNGHRFTYLDSGTGANGANTFGMPIDGAFIVTTDGVGDAGTIYDRMDINGLKIGPTGTQFNVSSNGTAITSSYIVATNGFTSYTNSLAVNSFTFPNTTVNWTNPVHVSIMVTIDNAGITGTVIKKNGTQIYGTTLPQGITIGLRDGEYFSQTYTVGTPVGTWSVFP